MITSDFATDLGLISANILRAHNAEGGVTYSLTNGNLAGKPKYAVAIQPERSVILDRPLSQDDITSFITENNTHLLSIRRAVGTWFNKEDSRTYIDIVELTGSVEYAKSLARFNNQIAIFDLEHGVEIPTGGTGTAL